MMNVIERDTGGGIFAIPNPSAIKIFDPINTNNTANAYFK
jgi:hypothetical protein